MSSLTLFWTLAGRRPKLVSTSRCSMSEAISGDPLVTDKQIRQPARALPVDVVQRDDVPAAVLPFLLEVHLVADKQTRARADGRPSHLRETVVRRTFEIVLALGHRD